MREPENYRVYLEQLENDYPRKRTFTYADRRAFLGCSQKVLKKMFPETKPIVTNIEFAKELCLHR